MKLKKSFAHRDDWLDRPDPHNVTVGEWCPPYAGHDTMLKLSFDIGRKMNSEIIKLEIHRDDFPDVIKAMLNIDRESAIKAFASAVLET